MIGAVTVRPARPEDVGSLIGMIRDLATYEREPDAVETDELMLADALFCDSPTVFAHVAEVEAQVVGMAVWFVTFSTWTGRSGLYLEDLYVRPGVRHSGVGRALLAALAALAAERGCARIDWSVLDWNESALGFYRSLGARPMDGWTSYRLDGDRLGRVAREG